MGCCDFRATCHFLNVKAVVLPLTTSYARTSYCLGDFTHCAIYKAAKAHAIDKVPRYVLPDDKYELHNRIVENASRCKVCR